MIELINISKNYCHQGIMQPALQNINLRVNTGEILGIIGKSGAGKSTLVRCVNLLERPSVGKVFVAGEELTALSGVQLRQARRHIGMIFQQFHLLSSCSVFDNVALPLRLQKIKSAQIAKQVTPLLELVGLADKHTVFPAQLSGGQKQRVAIARALAMQPRVLLCDEATSALDPQNTEAILHLLKEINQQLQLTVLIITHEMQVIKQICDRVAVLDKGVMVEEGRVAEIFAHPQMPVTRYFVESALKAELPITLREKLLAHPQAGAIPVWRIYFRGQAAAEPVISHLAKVYGLTLNIMQASLESIQQYTMGIMIAAVESDDTMLINTVIAYLAEKKLQVETVGYVSRDAI